MTDSTASEPMAAPAFRNRKWLFFLCVPLLLFGLSAVVMLLWNAILPHVLPLKPLSYWQAMGLLVLCRILFGGFRFGSRAAGSGWAGKCQTLDEVQKARIKAEWQKRCGSFKV